ncbi:dephospho-CoA kinase [Steroidobacter sp.]|uniref:dephospho-CoA kinase n=1 Tax=Steroidobacter sp. TaxID=1978227 RepID=UPI001A4988BF|nr:dephospho-CoA kinase [Steroidobacter sp.]MBL8268660.1 dephospho-CoA kinase [Steroidobacter sp.]
MTQSSNSPSNPNFRPLLVGLTGGIASGKSAVAELFSQIGAPVLDTDQIARDVVEPGTPTLAKLVAEFGSDILDSSGRLDRARMRTRVFADPEQRKRLEAITHPAIREELASRAQRAEGPYQIHVIPLLVESGRADLYDRVLLVDTSEEEQLKRLMARDSANSELAQQILAAQASREDRLDAADDVIVNTGTLQDLHQFVQTLHRNYTLLSERINALDTDDL